MMYRARFSIASSSFGWMRFPQKTWNPECRHVESMEIMSLEIFPLAISVQTTYAGTWPPVFSVQEEEATRNIPFG